MKDEITKISERFNIPEAEIRELLNKKTKAPSTTKINNPKSTIKVLPKENQNNNTEKQKNSNQFYFFTEEEYNNLLNKIKKIEEEIDRLGKEMGESCTEGAETYHDNFVYEEGIRQQHIWSGQLKKLRDIKNKVKVLEKNKINTKNVYIGNTVTIKNNLSDEIITLKIGGYMTIEPNTISYKSPLAKILIGGKKDETRNGIINKEKTSFKILTIES